jgi:hypothetical protein
MALDLPRQGFIKLRFSLNPPSSHGTGRVNSPHGGLALEASDETHDSCWTVWLADLASIRECNVRRADGSMQDHGYRGLLARC